MMNLDYAISVKNQEICMYRGRYDDTFDFLVQDLSSFTCSKFVNFKKLPSLTPSKFSYAILLFICSTSPLK